MNKTLPDRWIRKALFEALTDEVVDYSNVMNLNGSQIGIFDYRGKSNFDKYILITTQSNLVDESVKCGDRWENITTLEVFVRYLGTGNPGSRLEADNILDEVRERTKSLVLDPASGLTIEDQTESYPNDLVTVTEDNNIFRKFVRYELLIN